MKTLLALCAFLMSFNVYASNTATLFLQGVVNGIYNLSIVPETAATQLDILNGETNKLVGVATETSNNPLGFKIQISSANNGQLKNGSIDFVQYQLSYNDGTNMPPTTTPTTVKTYNNPAVAGVTSNIKVTFIGKPSALMGTYTDTLTFTITAP